LTVRKSDYVLWYRRAQNVLGDLLPNLSDDQIMSWVSDNNWLMFPLSSEKTKDEGRNRPQPNVYIELTKEGGIRIGLVCNTLDSVRKMGNILDSFHSQEKAEFIQEMKQLDDGFRTFVSKKRKANYAATPEYEQGFGFTTNKADDSSFHKLFEEAQGIRENGVREMRAAGKTYPPEAPVIDLATVQIEAQQEQYDEKLKQLKRLYELGLKIKTTGEIIREKRRVEKHGPKESIVSYRCGRCNSEYKKEQLDQGRFCPKDGAIIKPTVTWRTIYPWDLKPTES
jgi:hypothetical protein